jgi:hypothetical protein
MNILITLFLTFLVVDFLGFLKVMHTFNNMMDLINTLDETNRLLNERITALENK